MYQLEETFEEYNIKKTLSIFEKYKSELKDFIDKFIQEDLIDSEVYESEFEYGLEWNYDMDEEILFDMVKNRFGDYLDGCLTPSDWDIRFFEEIEENNFTGIEELNTELKNEFANEYGELCYFYDNILRSQEIRDYFYNLITK